MISQALVHKENCMANVFVDHCNTCLPFICGR